MNPGISAGQRRGARSAGNTARDSRADGTFILRRAPPSIYCRPSCPARRPSPPHAVFFRTGEEAEQQGFRPGLRLANPIKNWERWPWSKGPRGSWRAGAKTAATRTTRPIVAKKRPRPRSRIGRKLGVTPSGLRRAFQQVTGLSPRVLADALRLNASRVCCAQEKT